MTMKSIEVARDEVRDSLARLVDEATDIVDEYWLVWRIQNKNLKKVESQPGTQGWYLRGNIAPRIFERTGKVYIEWINYGPGRYGGRKKSWGERIAPKKGPVYHMSQFKNKTQPWEMELIEEYENKLQPFRYAIDRIHSTQVYLNSLLFKCNGGRKSTDT